MLSQFIEDCSRLLPDGAADSARCMGLCTQSTCRSTMPARELFANDWERTVADNSPNLNLLEISCRRNERTVSELKVTVEMTWNNIFRRSN